MDNDTIWTTTGKVATTPAFWKKYASSFVTSAGITPAFSKMLGEMAMEPLKQATTPFYNAFAGRPLMAGTAWGERVLSRRDAVKFNPKATAEDAFGFYENEGLEAVNTMSVAGRISISIPSTLELSEMIQDSGKIGEFASRFKEQEVQAYQQAMESEIAQKVISTTTASESVAIADFSAVRKKIRDIASSMHTNLGKYTELTDDEKAKYMTKTNDVLCFIPETLANDMTSDEAGLPSPDRLVTNARVIVIPDDAMVTPITSDAYTAGETAQGWDAGDKPAGADAVKPSIYMCSARRCEYRPYLGSYRVNYNVNGAGDYENYHLIFKGSIGIRRWENAVRIVPT